MADMIRIMVVDDNVATRNNLRKLLELEADMEVVCDAANGEEAVRKAAILAPDIILMDINMPGMDGIAATEVLSNEFPQSMVIVVSVQGEQEYLRRAMAAGAKDYLVKPFESSELLECIRHIFNREQKRREKFRKPEKKATLAKTVTIFSTKGGIGKTTIATNLGAALGFDDDNKVCIVDLDLQFGDVSLFLNIVPNVTIAELVKEIDNLDASLLSSYLTKYKENVHILAAPFRPEQADSITQSHVTAIIKELQFHYDYIIVDTAPAFSEMILGVLDLSTTVFVATSQDLPTLKNVKLCLEILESLHYPEDKIKLILNRANSVGGMSIKDSEDVLQRRILSYLPSDGRTVVTAVNKGIPFVVSDPDTVVAQNVLRLANYIISGDQEYINSANKKPKGRGIISKAAEFILPSNPKDKGKSGSKGNGEQSFWSFS